MLLKAAFGGIWCEIADLVIDPGVKVKNAIITHAHSDHARASSDNILCHRITEPLIRLRLGHKPKIKSLEYGECLRINGVNISLHPAGHIPGSAQVRLEYQGEIWVASGDYKLTYDEVSTAFEPVACHHFITESTFALPVFRLPDPKLVIKGASRDFSRSLKSGCPVLVSAYSFGKAQRLAHAFSQEGFEIVCTPAIAAANNALQATGCIRFPWEAWNGKSLHNRQILLFSSGENTGFRENFNGYEQADFSGWHHIPGIRNSYSSLRYPLSDHADWDELISALKQSKAENIWCTHGFSEVLAKYATEELGLNGRIWGNNN